MPRIPVINTSHLDRIDELLVDNFETGEFTQDDIIKGLSLAVRSGEVIPVYFGAATKMTGIERLLDLIVEYFPTYAERGTVEAFDKRTTQ